MKRFLGAFFIAGLFFYISFSSEAYLNNSCSDMTQHLEICAQKIKAQEYDNAILELEVLEKKWKENVVLLSIVSGDDMLLGPGKDIPAIYDSVRDKNYSGALVLIRECQGYFEEVIESHRLSIGNIL